MEGYPASRTQGRHWEMARLWRHFEGVRGHKRTWRSQRSGSLGRQWEGRGESGHRSAMPMRLGSCRCKATALGGAQAGHCASHLGRDPRTCTLTLIHTQHADTLRPAPAERAAVPCSLAPDTWSPIFRALISGWRQGPDSSPGVFSSSGDTAACLGPDCPGSTSPSCAPLQQGPGHSLI